MKRILLSLVLAVVLLLSIPEGIVSAEESSVLPNGTYRATEDITVYSMSGIKQVAVYKIPSSYYFEITANDENVYYISYNNVSGGIKDFFVYATSKFTAPLSSETDAKTGLKVPLNLSAKSENVTFYKHSDVGFQKNNIDKSNTSLYLIGCYEKYDGIDCAFVLVEDTKTPENSGFGYVARAALETKDGVSLTTYSIPLHSNSIPKTTPVTEEPKVPEDNNIVRIILIIGIVVPALIIIVLLFKPNNPKNKSHYDYNRNRGFDGGTSPYDSQRGRFDDRDYYRNDRYDEQRDRYDRYDERDRDRYERRRDDRYDDRRY